MAEKSRKVEKYPIGKLVISGDFIPTWVKCENFKVLPRILPSKNLPTTEAGNPKVKTFAKQMNWR